MSYADQRWRREAAAKREKELQAHPLFREGLPVPTKQLPTDWYFIERHMQGLDGCSIACASLGIKPVLIPYEVERAYEQWLDWRCLAGDVKLEPMERVTVILGLMLRHEALGEYINWEVIAT